MLSKYDCQMPVLIGTLSESKEQIAQWGHISYGGGGIILSRAMLLLFNEPGQSESRECTAVALSMLTRLLIVEACLEKYGSSFGGDAMVSHCSAFVTGKDVKEILTIEDSLHQLDIRGDGTGFFQSGFLISSIHHWGGSWFTMFPGGHETGAGDLRKGILLVGKIAKLIGGDNFGRRFVFEDGKVVVNLGYSITIEATPLTPEDLKKSEHTWWRFETFHPIRPGKEEGVEKRTYYITAVRELGNGVIRIEHRNHESERVDIIWDGTSRPKKPNWLGLG